MTRADAAVDLFRRGHSCSQAVLLAFSPDLGIDPATAARLATGFASGMRIGGACGAVTGGIMVLGLALAGDDCVVRSGRGKVAEAVSEFGRRFRERNPSLTCPGIMGCDVRTPEGALRARELDLHATVCAKAVRDAAELLEVMLPPRG